MAARSTWSRIARAPIQKSGACIGKFYATRLATKQLHIEFLFERADLEAQRRLNAKPLGGAGDVFFFRTAMK